MMFRQKKPLFVYDSIQENLIQYKGYWLLAMKVQSCDIENVGEYQQEAILGVFQNVLKSFPTNAQIIYRKTPIDNRIYELDMLKYLQKKDYLMSKYGYIYLDYLDEVTKGKLDKVNYLIIRTERKCSYIEAEAYLKASFEAIKETFETVNASVTWVTGSELSKLYKIPAFIKEGVDYIAYGANFKRTYIIQDYPRMGFPNWLRPLLSFKHPIEFSQHFHPFPKDKVIHQLEITSAKMQSTMDMQADYGARPSSEIEVRKEDLEDLIQRLASGEEAIMEVSFYITLSEETLDELDMRSSELESYMKILGLKYRVARKEMKKALTSILPLCDNYMLESYTFDTKSLSTILPFTVQDYHTKNGILYFVSHDDTELISFNRHEMPNPNMIVLGASGYGKSMFTKVTHAREIVNGSQGLIIDHNGEWKEYCNLLGGQYVTEEGVIDWSGHLIVLNYKSKAEALKVLWSYITTHELQKRLLIIDEFHNILKEDKELMLQVIKEIRKYFVAPTLITQNVKEFLRSDEGQMIMDNCSIKVFFHQGENDLLEIDKLFGLSQNEKIYLQTCPKGKGYLYTPSFKTRFRVDYSMEEEKALSTNPFHKTGGI